jgi:hypothetical protein
MQTETEETKGESLLAGDPSSVLLRACSPSCVPANASDLLRACSSPACLPGAPAMHARKGSTLAAPVAVNEQGHTYTLEQRRREWDKFKDDVLSRESRIPPNFT